MKTCKMYLKIHLKPVVAYLRSHAKAAVAGAITILYAVQSALSDGTITGTEWIGIAALALTTLGVHQTPNAPQADS